MTTLTLDPTQTHQLIIAAQYRISQIKADGLLIEDRQYKIAGLQKILKQLQDKPQLDGPGTYRVHLVHFYHMSQEVEVRADSRVLAEEKALQLADEAPTPCDEDVIPEVEIDDLPTVRIHREL